MPTPRIEYAEINLATATSQTVTPDQCEFIGVWPSVAMSAHAATITDGAAGTLLKTVPASSGVTVELSGMAIEVTGALTVVSDALATGKLIVAYRPAPKL